MPPRSYGSQPLFGLAKELGWQTLFEKRNSKPKLERGRISQSLAGRHIALLVTLGLGGGHSCNRIANASRYCIASKTPVFLLFFRLDGDPWFGTRC